MVQNIAERAQRRRDLKGELGGLGGQVATEVIFEHISPGREPVIVYSTLNGEPIPVPAYMIDPVMMKTLPGGRPMFVAKKEEAPEFKLGTVKCFLHPESPERASGVLAEIGLAGKTCPAEHLASMHSKRVHGLHRHKQEWMAHQEFIADQKTEAHEARQERTLQATLAIAGKAAAPAAEEPVAEGQCDICGKTGFKNLGAHKRGAHQA